MNRNSPIPFWTVLSIGVVLLAGVYAFAQRTTAPPQASIAVRQPSVIQKSSASARPSVDAVASTFVVPSAPSQTIVPTYSGVIEIGTADQLNIPGKYQCGAYSITKPEAVHQPYDHTMYYPNDIFFEPSGKFLLHLSEPPGSGPEYDATFSKNCHYLYYFDSTTNDNRIHVLDASSGARSTLTIPISAFPTTLVLSRKYSPYYPSLKFIYAVDDDHLLMWFRNPVSGPDWGINDTSQAVYSISTKSLTFVSEGKWTLHPCLNRVLPY